MVATACGANSQLIFKQAATGVVHLEEGADVILGDGWV